MRTKRLPQDRQLEERIALRPNHLGELLKLHEIKAQKGISPDPVRYDFPDCPKLIRLELIAEVEGQKRSIVVAQFTSEPGEAARSQVILHSQRQQKERRPTDAP